MPAAVIHESKMGVIYGLIKKIKSKGSKNANKKAEYREDMEFT